MARSRRTRALQTSAASRGGPIYVFATDEPLRIKNAKLADPQAIGEELARIAELNDGHLSPQAAKEAARDPANVLHKHFEWDDRLAAEAHRDDQARRLIRVVRIVDDERDEPPRAFLSISESPNGGVFYRTVGDVANNRTLQEAALRALHRDLTAMERRSREIMDVCSLIQEARARVRERIDRLSTQPEARPQ